MPNRRDFLSTALSSVAYLSLKHKNPAPGNRQPRPNVLFISIDDINDWIGGLNGHPDVQTPNLDALSARGTLFTRAYCTAPVCNPSRTSLLTGLRPDTTGLHRNGDVFRDLLPDVLTLPEYFKANGYYLLSGGKIFHDPEENPWHEYYTRPGDPLPAGRPLNGISNTDNFDWGPLDVPDTAMGDAKLTDWATEQLQAPYEQPFFMAVGYLRPHLPWYVPRKYFDRYPLETLTLPQTLDDDLVDIPSIGQQWADLNQDHQRILQTNNWRKAVQAYLASITFVDAQIGRLLDSLYASNYADNTIVVVCSDHGWHLGQKLHWRKFALWEEATRVPFIIAAPGQATIGQPCGRTVSLLDLFPTLNELCNLAPVYGHEGHSLVPLLDHPDDTWPYPAITTYQVGNHSVRTERWRYIRYSDKTEELYDHDVDLLEWNNLASDPAYGSVIQALAAWLEFEPGHIPTLNDLPPEQPPQTDPAPAGNFPNPFSDTTTISFINPECNAVTLTIFDTLGREVQVFSWDILDAGLQTVFWDGRDKAGRDTPSGVYLCRIQMGKLVNHCRLLRVR